jgi:hypothetical protein
MLLIYSYVENYVAAGLSYSVENKRTLGEEAAETEEGGIKTKGQWEKNRAQVIESNRIK